MAGDWKPKLQLTHNVEQGDTIAAAFVDQALERGLKEVVNDGWATSASSLEPLGEPLLRYVTPALVSAAVSPEAAAYSVQAMGEIAHALMSGESMSLEWLGEPLLRYVTPAGQTALFEWQGSLLEVGLWGAHVRLTVAAAQRATAEKIVDELRASFPLPDPSASHDVPITFWTYTPQGAQPAVRTVGVPEWDDIADNYSRGARAQLEHMMRGFQPARGGQLVLWHGEAGTGKTFALRALAWEWREWCQFHYIVDPDSFFGQHADYLISVLLQPVAPMMLGQGGFGMQHVFENFPEFDQDEYDEESEKPWRVLVLEDTGELLSADAREAGAWLEQHGLEGEAASRTLASLYAQLEGRDPKETVLVGFGD